MKHIMNGIVAAAFLVASRLLAQGADPLVGDTYHNDGRDTPAFHLPAPTGIAAPVNRTTAESYLQAEHARFKLPADLSNLTLVSTRESLLGTHYRYQQTLNGVPVERAEIIVSLTRNGEPYHVFNNTYPLAQPPAAKAQRLSADQALDIAWNHLRVHGPLRAAPKADLIYVPEGKGARLAYRTLVSTEAPAGDWEHRIDADTGNILSVKDTVIHESKTAAALPAFEAYAGPIASRPELTAQWTTAAAARAQKTAAAAQKNRVNGSALVFDPDPRTALMNGALLDTSPDSAFTAAYVTRTLRDISETNGVYSLEGPWVTIAEIEAPVDAPSTTANGQWTAHRGNNAFNDVMTYFHIDQNQRYLQSLGYVGATGIQYASIQVDSDGVDGDDNSHYSPAANTMAFGHGGVDDNEDADVILHEYGHAITENIVPGWGGGDGGAIGEGFGDYWGGTYSYASTNGTTYHPEWAFSWDGHGSDTWSGRLMNMTNLTYDPSHTYVAHETIGGTANYSDQLWSAPIFQGFIKLRQMGYPRTDMDKIMIESFYHVSSSPTMRDLASAIVTTAMQLYPTGSHATVFYEKFTNQLILTAFPLPPPVIVYPTAGEVFATGSTVRVRWDRRGAIARARDVLDYAIAPTPGFQDDMENGTNGWTRSHAGVLVTDWTLVTTASRSPTHSWFADDDKATNDQFLVSPVMVPASGHVLSFWHNYDLESAYDGGVVEISTNGSLWTDLGTNATQNGYTATIDTGYSSPIAGRRAFSGSSGGFIQTIIPLTGFVGKSVRIRFREADDDQTRQTGWWVDDVTVGQAVAWSNAATSATNASSLLWTLPKVPGSNYILRLKQTGTNCTDSTWVQGEAFTISVDSDGDGIPDAWELKYFAGLTNANTVTDNDHDGFPDSSEYVAGTLPNSATSRLRLLSVSNNTDQSISIRWDGGSNRDYSVTRATNLVSGYSVIATNLSATPPVSLFRDTNPPPAAARFYRVGAQ